MNINNTKRTKKNRFDLILIAAKRARQIQIENKENLTKHYKNKCTTIALQEIEKKFNF